MTRDGTIRNDMIAIQEDYDNRINECIGGEISHIPRNRTQPESFREDNR